MQKQKDKGLFWVKVETPASKSGFLPGELNIDENDALTLKSPRANTNSFIKLFPSKPLPKDSIVSLAFHDKNIFELWSCEIAEYLGFDEGYDTYELSSMRKEMSSSERIDERYQISVPLILESQRSKLGKVYQFSGCEINENGVGLWLPMFLKSKVRNGEEFTLTFCPKEVDPFSVTIKSVRPHAEDYFSKGFYAGFQIMKDDIHLNELAHIRIKQLIEAKGVVHKPDISRPGHYLVSNWQGEFFKELHS